MNESDKKEAERLADRLLSPESFAEGSYLEESDYEEVEKAALMLRRLAAEPERGPLAWMRKNVAGQWWLDYPGIRVLFDTDKDFPLYRDPPPLRELSQQCVIDVWNAIHAEGGGVSDFARALLTKAREEER